MRSELRKSRRRKEPSSPLKARISKHLTQGAWQLQDSLWSVGLGHKLIYIYSVCVCVRACVRISCVCVCFWACLCGLGQDSVWCVGSGHKLLCPEHLWRVGFGPHSLWRVGLGHKLMKVGVLWSNLIASNKIIWSSLLMLKVLGLTKPLMLRPN